MKLLQINAVNGLGSTGRTTTEIADYCNSNEHIGIVAYSEGIDYVNGYKIGSYIEKKIHGLFSRIFGLQGYFSKRGTKKLIDYIKKEQPDVIRLGNLHSNFINIPLLLKFLGENDIATIITLDDCFFFTGRCTHYTVDRCYKWKTTCGECPRLTKDNPSWFFDNSSKMLNDKKLLYKNIPRLAVVGVSNWITREARQSILSSAKYIQTIYNWIDIDKFKPIDTSNIRKEMNMEDTFIILGVATEWSNNKGLDKFIELSKQLEEDEIIFLVGKIPNNINLPINIIHIERTDNIDELVKYYCLANVFLQLSEEESFGKVVAESLSCGTPVIAFDSTANSELVIKGCGYVAENSSMSDVIKYIKKIKNDSKVQYSYLCRKFALDNFEKNSRILDYIQLSEKLINIQEK